MVLYFIKPSRITCRYVRPCIFTKSSRITCRYMCLCIFIKPSRITCRYVRPCIFIKPSRITCRYVRLCISEANGMVETEEGGQGPPRAVAPGRRLKTTSMETTPSCKTKSSVAQSRNSSQFHATRGLVTRLKTASHWSWTLRERNPSTQPHFEIPILIIFSRVMK